MKEIESDIEDNTTWINADETTDGCGFYLAHLLYRKMSIKPHPHLIICKEFRTVPRFD